MDKGKDGAGLINAVASEGLKLNLTEPGSLSRRIFPIVNAGRRIDTTSE
jgi:hypothetical protein